MITETRPIINVIKIIIELRRRKYGKRLFFSDIL